MNEARNSILVVWQMDDRASAAKALYKLSDGSEMEAWRAKDQIIEEYIKNSNRPFRASKGHGWVVLHSGTAGEVFTEIETAIRAEGLDWIARGSENGSRVPVHGDRLIVTELTRDTCMHVQDWETLAMR